MDSNNFEKSLNECVGLRGDARAYEINRASKFFYNFLKRNNHSFFYRDLIKSFFGGEVKPKTQNLIIKDILKTLLENGRVTDKELINDEVKPFVVSRSCNPHFEVKPLVCLDGGSYSVMMAYNGYAWVNFYKWGFDDVKKCPKRILVDRQKIGNNSQKDFDFSVLVQTKPRARQGVLTNSQNSIIKRRNTTQKQAFKVL